MSWKLTIGTALVAAAAFGFALVYAERTAPLPEKPSIRLLVFTGKLPTGDLAAVLAQEERAVMEARERLALTETAQGKHLEWNKAAWQVYTELEERIAEKQAGQWSTLRPQQP